eukprot:CAMPEP_0182424894 /NCGR_PEP_ID=MMETSP1167-20130531/11162_1 /TAXON_ID=2988 /ORGANISM="Mallomonas Sp, Strain CCMP3275" /LENGTH=215 /DNA_ID=CAMNT_0024605053 /DNA_START=113 /DNA_END=760 /DNA_ORIENTATION=-
MMTGFRYRAEAPIPDVPLFDRNESNEFVELNENRKIKEGLQRRVTDLEKIVVDLEHRLEEQAKINMQVEKECMEIERVWKAKYLNMEQEVEEWKKKFHQQELKGDRLREHLSRTERELYGLLQRKYQIMRGPGGSGTGGGTGTGQGMGTKMQSHTRLGGAGAGGAAEGEKKDDVIAMPLSYAGSNEDILVSQHTRSPKDMQQRRMLADLGDFFGM